MSVNHLNQLVNKNQSIKIVPPIEDFLRGLGLDVDLDDDTANWYQQLKATWKGLGGHGVCMKHKELENSMMLFFSTIEDPFRVALVFVIKSEDFKDCKLRSLPFFIVQTIKNWSRANDRMPADSLKLPAFHIAIQQRNPNFLKLISNTYHLNTLKATIIPIVKDMIRGDNCKLASQIIIAVELFEDIAVEDLLFPLILQDKINLIDEYLGQCPSQVHALLNFLDSLLDKKVNLKEYAAKFIQDNNIHNVKTEKIHHKPIGKLVARLCNKFNIPIENCKNLSKNRTTGGLRFLIYQKYVEHNVSSSVWDDLVKDSLRQNAGSAQEFIDMLVDHDLAEAHKWATYLNMAESDLPLALKEMSIPDTSKEEDWDNEIENNCQGYYKISLDDEHIVMVDTAEKFYDTIMKLKDCKVVSLDCEWKPSFGAKQSQVALMQIATYDYVYLIDTMVLNKPAYLSFWHAFNKHLLNNAEIIKIGFGLELDLKEIKGSIVGLGNIKVKDEGLLDMASLWKNLTNVGFSLANNDENSGHSLSYLVQLCFGLPLEKSEQCSNWELRPLRKTQIQYAALDAYVLMEIYNFLEKKCTEQFINFEDLCNNTMTEAKKKPIKKVKGHERLQPCLPNYPPKSPNDIKFLVEPKLSHLMAYFRYCGIDTIVTPKGMLWCDVINLAISEDRYILVNKFKATPSSNFPQTSILDVEDSSIIDQLRNVLSNFNIRLTQNDLFKICIKCNKKDLKLLTPQDANKLCTEYESTKSTNYQFNDVPYYDSEPNFDNFLSDSDDEDLYQMVPVVTQTKKSCKTSKGATIEISNPSKLLISNKSAILCEDCGGVYWYEDIATKSVIDAILSLTNVTCNL